MLDLAQSHPLNCDNALFVCHLNTFLNLTYWLYSVNKTPADNVKLDFNIPRNN